MQNLKKNSSITIQEYITQFKTIFDEFALIGRVIGDSEKTYYLFKGLGSEYDAFTTTMMKPPVPSCFSLVPQLMSNDIRNNFC